MEQESSQESLIHMPPDPKKQFSAKLCLKKDLKTFHNQLGQLESLHNRSSRSLQIVKLICTLTVIICLLSALMLTISSSFLFTMMYKSFFPLNSPLGELQLQSQLSSPSTTSPWMNHQRMKRQVDNIPLCEPDTMHQVYSGAEPSYAYQDFFNRECKISSYGCNIDASNVSIDILSFDGSCNNFPTINKISVVMPLLSYSNFEKELNRIMKPIIDIIKENDKIFTSLPDSLIWNMIGRAPNLKAAQSFVTLMSMTASYSSAISFYNIPSAIQFIDFVNLTNVQQTSNILAQNKKAIPTHYDYIINPTDLLTEQLEYDYSSMKSYNSNFTINYDIKDKKVVYGTILNVRCNNSEPSTNLVISESVDSVEQFEELFFRKFYTFKRLDWALLGCYESRLTDQQIYSYFSEFIACQQNVNDTVLKMFYHTQMHVKQNRLVFNDTQYQQMMWKMECQTGIPVTKYVYRGKSVVSPSLIIKKASFLYLFSYRSLYSGMMGPFPDDLFPSPSPLIASPLKFKLVLHKVRPSNFVTDYQYITKSMSSFLSYIGCSSDSSTLNPCKESSLKMLGESIYAVDVFKYDGFNVSSLSEYENVVYNDQNIYIHYTKFVISNSTILNQDYLFNNYFNALPASQKNQTFDVLKGFLSQNTQYDIDSFDFYVKISFILNSMCHGFATNDLSCFYRSLVFLDSVDKNSILLEYSQDDTNYIDYVTDRKPYMLINKPRISIDLSSHYMTAHYQEIGIQYQGQSDVYALSYLCPSSNSKTFYFKPTGNVENTLQTAFLSYYSHGVNHTGTYEFLMCTTQDLQLALKAFFSMFFCMSSESYQQLIFDIYRNSLQPSTCDSAVDGLKFTDFSYQLIVADRSNHIFSIINQDYHVSRILFNNFFPFMQKYIPVSYDAIFTTQIPTTTTTIPFVVNYDIFYTQYKNLDYDQKCYLNTLIFRHLSVRGFFNPPESEFHPCINMTDDPFGLEDAYIIDIQPDKLNLSTNQSQFIIRTLDPNEIIKDMFRINPTQAHHLLERVFPSVIYDEQDDTRLYALMSIILSIYQHSLKFDILSDVLTPVAISYSNKIFEKLNTIKPTFGETNRILFNKIESISNSIPVYLMTTLNRIYGDSFRCTSPGSYITSTIYNTEQPTSETVVSITCDGSSSVKIPVSSFSSQYLTSTLKETVIWSLLGQRFKDKVKGNVRDIYISSDLSQNSSTTTYVDYIYSTMFCNTGYDFNYQFFSKKYGFILNKQSSERHVETSSIVFKQTDVLTCPYRAQNIRLYMYSLNDFIDSSLDMSDIYMFPENINYIPYIYYPSSPNPSVQPDYLTRIDDGLFVHQIIYPDVKTESGKLVMFDEENLAIWKQKQSLFTISSYDMIILEIPIEIDIDKTFRAELHEFINQCSSSFIFPLAESIYNETLNHLSQSYKNILAELSLSGVAFTQKGLLCTIANFFDSGMCSGGDTSKLTEAIKRNSDAIDKVNEVTVTIQKEVDTLSSGYSSLVKGVADMKKIDDDRFDAIQNKFAYVASQTEQTNKAILCSLNLVSSLNHFKLKYSTSINHLNHIIQALSTANPNYLSTDSPEMRYFKSTRQNYDLRKCLLSSGQFFYNQTYSAASFGFKCPQLSQVFLTFEPQSITSMVDCSNVRETNFDLLKYTMVTSEPKKIACTGIVTLIDGTTVDLGVGQLPVEMSKRGDCYNAEIFLVYTQDLQTCDSNSQSLFCYEHQMVPKVTSLVPDKFMWPYGNISHTTAVRSYSRQSPYPLMRISEDMYLTLTPARITIPGQIDTNFPSGMIVSPGCSGGDWFASPTCSVYSGTRFASVKFDRSVNCHEQLVDTVPLSHLSFSDIAREQHDIVTQIMTNLTTEQSESLKAFAESLHFLQTQGSLISDGLTMTALNDTMTIDEYRQSVLNKSSEAYSLTQQARDLADAQKQASTTSWLVYLAIGLSSGSMALTIITIIAMKISPADASVNNYSWESCGYPVFFSDSMGRQIISWVIVSITLLSVLTQLGFAMKRCCKINKLSSSSRMMVGILVCSSITMLGNHFLTISTYFPMSEFSDWILQPISILMLSYLMGAGLPAVVLSCVPVIKKVSAIERYTRALPLPAPSTVTQPTSVDCYDIWHTGMIATTTLSVFLSIVTLILIIMILVNYQKNPIPSNWSAKWSERATSFLRCGVPAAIRINNVKGNTHHAGIVTNAFDVVLYIGHIKLDSPPSHILVIKNNKGKVEIKFVGSKTHIASISGVYPNPKYSYNDAIFMDHIIIQSEGVIQKLKIPIEVSSTEVPTEIVRDMENKIKEDMKKTALLNTFIKKPTKYTDDKEMSQVLIEGEKNVNDILSPEGEPPQRMTKYELNNMFAYSQKNPDLRKFLTSPSSFESMIYSKTPRSKEFRIKLYDVLKTAGHIYKKPTELI